MNNNLPTFTKNKENSNNNTNIKTYSMASINWKNTPNKIKISRKNSGVIIKKIPNKQKEKDRYIISQRISNQEKNYQIKRNNTAITKKIIKIEKEKEKEKEKEELTEKTIHEIKILNKRQSNFFTIFYFLKLITYFYS